MRVLSSASIRVRTRTNSNRITSQPSSSSMRTIPGATRRVPTTRASCPGLRSSPWRNPKFFRSKTRARDSPRSVVLDSAKLPPAEEAWAWAHSHLNAVVVDPGNKRATADQIAADPAASCSRIVAARQLQPLKAYRAFVVPVFEAGRRAGLLSDVQHDRRLPGRAPDKSSCRSITNGRFAPAKREILRSSRCV